MKNIEDMKNLVKAYSWIEIPSKNPIMYSFRHEERKIRMNIYFTTMTITLQGESVCGNFISYHDVNIKLLEQIARGKK